MSASDLARSVGVTPTAVWNWENNGTQPRPETVSSLAKLLTVSKEFLISAIDERRDTRGTTSDDEGGARMTVAQVIESAKNQIAKLSGLPPERVKVSVEFATE